VPRPFVTMTEPSAWRTTMKRRNWLSVALMACALVAAARASIGAAPPPPAAGEANALRGVWAILAAEAQLTDAQKAKLLERLKAYEKAANAWEGENGGKLKGALDAGDANTAKALTAERDKLITDRDADIQAILTAEQKGRWEGHQLCRAELLALRRANPTEEQKKQIRAVCDECGAGYAALKDEAQRKAAREQLRQRTLNCLTAQQQEALRKAAQSGPAGAGATGGT